MNCEKKNHLNVWWSRRKFLNQGPPAPFFSFICSGFVRYIAVSVERAKRYNKAIS